MKLDFSRGAWNTDEITYAYTYRFPGAPEFLQQEDCVENRPDAAGTFGCGWKIFPYCRAESILPEPALKHAVPSSAPAHR